MNNFEKLTQYKKNKSSANRRMIISDVDGTLVKGSLVLRHACFLHDEGVVNLGDLPEQWLADQKNETLISKLAEKYREGIKNKSLDDIGAKEFVRELTLDLDNFYSSLYMLIKKRASGHDVRLISGSPSFLVTPFARTFGFKSKGSLYIFDDNGFTGEVIGMFQGDSKAKYVKTLKLEHHYDHVTAFGDTMSDKPLFDNAHFSVLVAPHEETLKNVGAVDMVLPA